MTGRDQFDAQQWQLLQLAPFLVLSGVSGRYRRFPAPELQVFERWLGEACRAPGRLSRAVLTSVADDLDGTTAAFECSEVTIVSGLTAIGAVVAGQPADEVACFRHALVRVLGEGLARARGPYGREVTVEGGQLLTMLEEFLRPTVSFRARPGDAA